MDIHAKENKGTLIVPETEKGILTQSDKPSTSLGKEVFQAQNPLLCIQVGVERLHTGDCLSQHYNFPLFVVF